MQGLTTGDAAILLACLALAAAVFVFVFLIERDREDGLPRRSKLDQLLERRDTIYENLRDLKFEHRAGKYSQSDFEEMKRALETEAALVLAEIEMLTAGELTPAARQAATEAARRQAASRVP